MPTKVKSDVDFSKFSKEDLVKAFEVYDYMGMNNMKAVPSDYTGWMYGYRGDNVGVFTDYSDDVISDLCEDGNEFQRWLPAEPVEEWYDSIAHLSFFTAQDYTGSTTYLAHLTGIDDIGECDFGPGADYQVYEYQHRMHRMSYSNKDYPITHTVGVPNHKKTSRKRLIGSRYNLSDDSMWVLAGLTELVQQHHNWVTWFGNPYAVATSNKNMIEGLDLIVREGWVESKMIGNGFAYWSDPRVADGTGIVDPVAQLRMIIANTAHIIQRMTERGYQPGPDDCALIMSKSHWKVYSEILAAGALVKTYSVSTELQVTPEVVMRELGRIQQARSINVMGYEIPVIIENALGVNTTTPAGHNAVIGDVYFLTRYYRGMNVLTYQYLDWNSGFLSDDPDPNIGPNLLFNEGMLGGMLRTAYGYTDAAQQCWFYGFEEWGRIVPKMMPLNGRFRNLIVPTELADDIESSQFWHQNFYVHEGTAGHQGTAMYTVQ